MSKLFLFFPDIGERFGTGHFGRVSMIYRMLAMHSKCILIHRDELSFLLKINSNIELINNLSETSIDSEKIKVLLIENAQDIGPIVQRGSLIFDISFFVDSYSIDETLEKTWIPYLSQLVVIDDLANRKHSCDILIDTTLNRTENDYLGLVPSQCKLLLGTAYCMINDAITTKRKKMSFTNISIVRRVHLFFGGFDRNNLTLKYLNILYKNYSHLRFNVVVSGAYPYLNDLNTAYLNDPRVLIFHNVDDIGKTFEDCEIALGAPGITTWERACLGLVGFYIATNENQIPILKEIAKAHFCIFFGLWSDISDQNFLIEFNKQILDTDRLNTIKNNAFSSVDGEGLNRILSEII